MTILDDFSPVFSTKTNKQTKKNNIFCGYSLESPQQGKPTKYPLSMFYEEITKKKKKKRKKNSKNKNTRIIAKNYIHVLLGAYFDCMHP